MPWTREEDCQRSSAALRRQGGGRSADRPPPAMGRHYSAGPGSRASIERIVGSGSEPTYLPLTNTSFAGLLLYFLGAANALDAVAMAMAMASAVLVNIVVSPAGWSITPHPVCAHLEPARSCRESPGGPMTEHPQQRHQRPLGEKTALIIKGVLAFRADSSGVCIGPGDEVLKSGRGLVARSASVISVPVCSWQVYSIAPEKQTMDATWCFLMGMIAGSIPCFAVLTLIILGSV